MPNGSSILRLIDAVLKETQRQARGTEARKLIQYAIQRVAAISVAQGLLQDPDGITRINIWDLLTAICLTVPVCRTRSSCIAKVVPATSRAKRRCRWGSLPRS